LAARARRARTIGLTSAEALMKIDGQKSGADTIGRRRTQ
jgi:hypothetical protein